MRANIRDARILCEVQPLNLFAYFRARQWRELERVEKGSFWGKKDDEGEFEVLLPSDSTLRDYASVTAELEPMRAAVHRGVSANLCEAILGLNQGGGGRGVEFFFSWALSRGAPPGALEAVNITPDVMPILEETVRLFRETAPVESSEVVGLVQKLEHMGHKGRVTVFGTVDGSAKSVVIDLSQEDHELAIKAYHDRLRVTCTGELVRAGNSWMLKNPRDFAIIDDGEGASRAGEEHP